MGTFIVIKRGGLAAAERAVGVYLVADAGSHHWGIKLAHWAIDPQQEIAQATGTTTSRYGCVMSFAEGLLSSGYRVRFERRFLNQSSAYFWYSSRGSVVLVYWLLGFASGLGQWERLKRTLQDYIAPSLRLAVLEYTARYYWERQYETRLRLQVPERAVA